jgi:hypothetical protein
MKSEACRLLGFLALGAGFGGAYLGALAWNVRLYCAGNTATALLLHVMRLLGTAVVFLMFAEAGAGSLFSSFLGFQLARSFAAGRRFFRLQAG